MDASSASYGMLHTCGWMQRICMLVIQPHQLAPCNQCHTGASPPQPVHHRRMRRRRGTTLRSCNITRRRLCITVACAVAGDDSAVVRYHSLAVDEATLPACLEPIAWARGVLPSASRQREAHTAQQSGAAAKQNGVSVAAAEEEAQQKSYGGAAPGLPPANDTPLSNGGSVPANVNEPRVLMGLAHRERPHCAVSCAPPHIRVRSAEPGELLSNAAGRLGKQAACRGHARLQGGSRAVSICLACS